MPPKNSAVGRSMYGDGPIDSPELRRIIALPKRTPGAPDLTSALRHTARCYGGCVLCAPRPKNPCFEGCPLCEVGEAHLWPLQSEALYWAQIANGLLGAIGVGGGKTLVTLLLPTYMPSARAVLLVPPQLRDQLKKMTKLYRRHWRVPEIAFGRGPEFDGLRVFGYSEISVQSGATALEEADPDLVICDEAHNLRHKDSVRTRRFIRLFRSRPGRRLVALSGSMTTKSVKDYCLDANTRVLTADLRWIPVGEVATGDTLIGFDETIKRCRLQPSIVESVQRVQQPRYRIRTTRGDVVCSALHQWILRGRPGASRGGQRDRKPHVLPGRWITTQDLKIGDTLAYYTQPWEFDSSREGGYLAGLLDGEGWVTKQSGQLGFGQKPGLILERYKQGLLDRGFTFSEHVKHKSGVVRILPNGDCSHARLLGMLRPARLLEKASSTWLGKEPGGRHTQHAQVLSIERLVDGEVVAVQTSTQTLIAEGFLTHNSHLMELALRKSSALPRPWPELDDWSRVIDANVDEERRMPPGALVLLGADKPCAPTVEAVRAAYRERLLATPGVVSSAANALPMTLTLRAARPKISPEVRAAIAKLENTWTRPDGEEIESPLAMAKVLREMCFGFYYVWDWPNGEPDLEWMTARALWHKEQRDYLKTHNKLGMDSPGYLAAAAASGRWQAKHWPRWSVIADRYGPDGPPVKTIWLDRDFAPRLVRTWMSDGPGIIWYEHTAIGIEIARVFQLEQFDGGTDKQLLAATPETTPHPVCSIRAHGTGKELQAWSRAIVLGAIANGTAYEQLLGRLHRDGQQADEVEYVIPLHHESLEMALDNAMAHAQYKEETFEGRQKLLYANIIR